MLTKSERDAETKDKLDVSINIDGSDVVSKHTIQWGILLDNMIHRGNASIAPVPNTITEPISFDSVSLTNSSVRVGITGRDMWTPEHILLIGPEAANGQCIPLAGEWDINTKLSTDATEGPGAKMTIPLRLVRLGSLSTTLRRVLLLVKTSHVDDAGSSDPIVLEITTGQGDVVLNQGIDDDSLEKSDSWYTLDLNQPSSKEQMINGRITLSIRGRDAWLPRQLYLFGLDTAEGRPNAMITLVSVTEWNMGWLSEDTSEGQPSVNLPIS